MAAPSDILSLTPLFPNEDEDAILARMRGWANEGLDPVLDAEQWVDVREGSLWQTLTESCRREIARLYDRAGTEAVAAAFVSLAWGEYLDLHAEQRGLERKAGTVATGNVQFYGTEDAVIEPGTRVIAAATGELDPPTFETINEAVVGALGSVTAAVRAVDIGSFYNVGPYTVTLIEGAVTGVDAVQNIDAIVGGTDAEVDLPLRNRTLDASKDTGAPNAELLRTWARDYPGIGEATIIPLAYGPGTVLVVVFTADNGPVSADTVRGFQQQVDPPKASTVLTSSAILPQATLAVQTTAGFRTAGAVRLGSTIVNYTGLTPTTFTGCTGGTGTYTSNTEVSQGGRGGGLAPVGLNVVVRTAVIQPLTLAVTLETETGYSLDGFGSTQAIRQDIRDAVEDYVESVPPGGEVVIAQIKGRVATVQGVHDVGSATIGGSSVNLDLTDDPPTVATIGSLLLTDTVL